MKTTYLIPLFIAVSLSCQTKPKQETTNETTVETPDSAALLAKRPGRNASRTVPDRLVRALYFEHNKTENPLRETKNRSLIDEFFAKPTADLIWNNDRRVHGTGKRTAVNPLFNAPDTAIKKMWVEPAAIGGTRAIVYVTFENNGKPEEVKVDIQQNAGRWGITDLIYPSGQRLTEILK